jgi:hypothetical protein
MKTVIEMAIEAGITPKQMPQPAWVTQWCAVKELERFAELVRADAQRPWVGLTLERKMDMAESYFTDEWAINRAIQLLSGCENALKEENGA